ncbi:gfo/Idh/MocA family oxidoreductase [candidate division KSB1 bacterium]|nr:gfo/Idh/MocA family oxidoreductase [candidate division KSB1 bacterium]
MNQEPPVSELNRRAFMRTALSAGAAFCIVPRHVLGGPNQVAPSDKINVAIIGCGGQSLIDMDNLIKFPEIQYVAMADPMKEWDYREFYFGGFAGREAAKRKAEDYYAGQRGKSSFKSIRTYADFREMLDQESGIDAVTIETTDNLHALATLAALEKGKHVYCQKPLTHDIYEARVVTEAARKAGVATQMGNQGHAMEGNRLVYEWINAGAIGDVREVHCWTDRPGGRWPQGVDVPEETPSVPRVLDWNLWLGPARYRAYHPIFCPFRWRGFWDFGTGSLGDMGCHIMDTPVWALDLRHPESVEAVMTTPYKDDTYPVAAMIQYEFPERDGRAPVSLTWYDGGLMPFRPKELEDKRRMGDSGGGVLLIGDKGTIMCGTYGDNPRLIPETEMKKFTPPPKTLKRTEGIYHEWVEACLGGDPATSNFDYSGPLTEVVLLGNVAMRFPNTRLYYDGANMKVTNIEEADQYIKRQYHGGWSL